MTIPQAFALGLQHHQASRLREAEALYRQVLEAQPGHAEARHYLGVLAQQAGRPDLAVELIRQAIDLDPGNAAAHSNLGEAHRSAGRLDEAIAAYRRALKLQPDFAAALNNLGNALRERRQLDEAEAACRRALALQPDYPEACNNLASVLADRGQLDEAVALYRRAVELRPDYPDAWNNLGGVLAEQGHLDEALSACRRALQLQPGFAAACNNLGATLTRQGQFDEAVTACRRALALQPDYPEAYRNLGLALAAQGRCDEAVVVYRQALVLRPNYPEAGNDLGIALAAQGRLDDAVAVYRRALELQPDWAEIHINLSNALKDQGLLDEAVAVSRRALELQPNHAAVHSNLISTLYFDPEQSDAAITAELQRWNRQFAGPLTHSILPHRRDRDPLRPLKIGYVSPDFGQNVLGRNILPLFRCHDPRDFEIVCYSGVARPDGLTEEFRRHARQWRNTIGVSDEALAEMIRQDGVDILVDLTLHAVRNRLPIFARQPAPVQVSFAGYPESTGLETIEHRISDSFLEPANETGRREQVCLIDSFWCYDPCGVEVEVNGLPARGNGGVTFGSLNDFAKLNEPVLKLWAWVLGAVPDSRLVLLAPAGSHRQRAVDFLQRQGVDAARVEFVERRPHADYLALYHRLDVALDPFPYGGHTTSLDALWMGVPVVSLVGPRSLSRAGWSHLSHLGLEDLAAFSEDDYVNIATRLAHDLPRLGALRAGLRARMKSSVLMDAPRFARNIEVAYRTMWRRWCTQEQP